MDKKVIDRKSDSWVDEGILAYQQSPHTCPSCVALKRGSITRRMIAPGAGQALVVAPDFISPPADVLRSCYGENVPAKKDVYEKACTIEQALYILPELKVPFGMVFGTGGDASKHFLRSVPLNWNHDIISVYLVAEYYPVWIRPALVLEAIKSIKAVVADESIARTRLREVIDRLKQDRGLTEAEKTVLSAALIKLEKGVKA